MAKKYDMRLNIYLDENEPKDKIVIDFLNNKYSAVGFIKETMYALATEGAVQGVTNIKPIDNEQLNNELHSNQDSQEEYEEIYEEIKGIREIEM